MLDGLNYTWHWSPITLAGLVILCLLYGMGIKLTYKDKIQTPLQRYRILAFAGAILLLALVLLTPLDTIARTQLFAAHMIQAVAITTLCAPLLLAACPDWLLPWRKLSYPQQMLYAFLDGQPVDIFAFLLVFTGVVFYKHYAIPSQFMGWGYSAVADQTIGGAFLLVPGLVDLVVMSPLFFLWLSQIERQAKVDDVRRQEEEEARLAAEGMEIEGTEAEA